MKMRSIGATVGILLIGAILAAKEPALRQAIYTDSINGFEFTSPAFPKAGPGQATVPVLVSGPAADGFASNVNVNLQPIATTRKGYLDLSLGQMDKLGFKVHSTTDATVSGKDAIRFDFEGKLDGRDLHFLSLAVIEQDRVILVTCTAMKDSFEAIEPEFKACLDSFRLK